jgi:O-antigen ligase
MDTPLPPDGKKRRSSEHRMHKHRRPSLIPPGAIARWAPMMIFAAIALLAPLLFGAVDRIVQIGLVMLLGIGMFLRPPSLVPLSNRANLVIMALLVILLLKEFAPWQWFGNSRWRTELTNDFQVILPMTHNPEPQRAVDALLAGVIGLVWFQWARTLASERGSRRVMGWVLFGAGVGLAVVCFAMGRREVSADGGAIYGLRYTLSWAGWGPFPNRNHTASFLAMSFLVGTGCLAWAVVKRRTPLIVTGSLGLLLVGAALLASQSRGGLVALGAGLLVFATFVLIRFFSMRTLALVIACGGLVITAVLLFGGDVLARFQSAEAGTVSNNMRLAIWKDTLQMWKDAPFFGHGLDTFSQLFSMYQTAPLDGAYARHPESSWLAWLAELGAVPLAIAVIALAIFVGTNLSAVLDRRGGFFISIGALAAFVGFLAHSGIDVPAHRWATAGLALALLAVACPVRSPDAPVPKSSRLSALVPVCIAAFWVLPIAAIDPAHSPLTLELLKERENWYELGGGPNRPPRPTVDEWRKAASYFPLDWTVQQNTAFRELESELPMLRSGKAMGHSWQWRFDLVSRLSPSLYGESMKQAYATAYVSKPLSIGYWQEAVTKAQREKAEILRIAVRETAKFPSASGRWDAYCNDHPELLLTYVSVLIEDLQAKPEEVRPHFESWWEQRALTAELNDDERANFHRYAQHWVNLEQVERWIKRNGGRRKTDFRDWGALFHKLGDEKRAWEVMSSVYKQPEPIDLPRNATIESMRELLIATPDNFASAASLVGALEKSGQEAEAREIINSVSKRENAPNWFLHKAAFVVAAEGKTKEAVELLLRLK